MFSIEIDQVARFIAGGLHARLVVESTLQAFLVLAVEEGSAGTHLDDMAPAEFCISAGVEKTSSFLSSIEKVSAVTKICAKDPLSRAVAAPIAERVLGFVRGCDSLFNLLLEHQINDLRPVWPRSTSMFLHDVQLWRSANVPDQLRTEQQCSADPAS